MTKVALIQDVEDFVKRAQPLYQYGELSVTQGAKYYKIVASTGEQRSAYAFVDNLGNIYKAAAWAKPAKNIRGNIFSEKQGLEALDAQGFIRYIR